MRNSRNPFAGHDWVWIAAAAAAGVVFGAFLIAPGTALVLAALLLLLTCLIGGVAFALLSGRRGIDGRHAYRTPPGMFDGVAPWGRARPRPGAAAAAEEDFPAGARGGEPAAPQRIVTAKVLRVIDGDTVDVKVGRQRVRVRLAAIDCPEDGQAWGDSATRGLIKLIGGRTVTLEHYDQDHYGRTVATLYVLKPDGQPVNVCEHMVMLGHAWVMRRHYGNLPERRRDALDQLEQWARRKRIGLWQSGDAVPPWTWRRTQAAANGTASDAIARPARGFSSVLPFAALKRRADR